MTYQQQPNIKHPAGSKCPDSPAISHFASSPTAPTKPAHIKEMTAMNSIAPRFHNDAVSVASNGARPKRFDIVTGKVVAVIKDKVKKDAVPHAVILSFGSASGLLRRRDLNGDSATQLATMKKVRRNDEFTVMVGDITGSALEPKYDLSESRATNLLAAHALIGQTVSGHVLNTAIYGAFIDIGEGRSGLLHISEMGSTNQERRRSQLKKGTAVQVSVLAVESDPTNPARFRFELSEVEAELKKAAELVGKKVTAKIVGPCNAGLKLSLKSGVEVILLFENFGSLKFRHPDLREFAMHS
jgi:ribosomal protein S1